MVPGGVRASGLAFDAFVSAITEIDTRWRQEQINELRSIIEDETADFVDLPEDREKTEKDMAELEGAFGKIMAHIDKDMGVEGFQKMIEDVLGCMTTAYNEATEDSEVSVDCRISYSIPIRVGAE